MTIKKQYQWDKAPVWAKYAARDSNGFAHWFEELPYPDMEDPFRLEWTIDRHFKTDSDCNPFWGVVDVPEALLSLESIDNSVNPEDPLSIYLGSEISVIRMNKGNVRVSIFRNKSDNTYSYVNLTKSHICSCKFKSIRDAFVDLSNYVKNGDVDFYSIELV